MVIHPKYKCEDSARISVDYLGTMARNSSRKMRTHRSMDILWQTALVFQSLLVAIGKCENCQNKVLYLGGSCVLFYAFITCRYGLQIEVLESKIMFVFAPLINCQMSCKLT